MNALAPGVESLLDDRLYAEALACAGLPGASVPVFGGEIFAGRAAPPVGLEGETEVLPPEPRVRCELRREDAGLFLGPIPAGSARDGMRQRLALLAHLADGLIAELRGLDDGNAERAARRLELVREQVSAISPNLQGLAWTEDCGV